MRLLRGELDWVVMKCLEKHRERRYETASGLARDIQRYLADEAVEARPPSAGYRFSKFVSRHKGRVIAASLVLLAVLGGLAAVAAVQTAANAQLSRRWPARQSEHGPGRCQRRAEELEGRRAARYELAVEAIKTFHTGVSEDFLLKQEQFKELRDRLLKSAVGLLRQARRTAGQGDGHRFAAVRWRLQLRAGRADGQGGPQGGRAGGAPVGAGGARGAGRRTGGRRDDKGRRRPKSHGGRGQTR